MATVQIATRVDEAQANTFREIAQALGTTASDALRMFIAAFNANRGFPYDVRLAQQPEAFANEAEALDFIDSMASEVFDEER